MRHRDTVDLSTVAQNDVRASFLDYSLFLEVFF